MEEYYNYLKSRSSLGFYYRKFILYPRIKQYSFDKTLDVGCGVGDYLKFDSKAVGVDINTNCVNHCLDNGLKASVMKIDNLPFETNSFDTLVFDNVLEHIEDPTKILSEVNRVLNPNGYFIIGVPCEKGYKYDDDHKIFYDIKSLKKLLFKDYSLEKYFYSPPLFYPFRHLFNQVALYAVFKKHK